MIRFLLLSALIFSLYLGFSVLSQLDSPISVSIYDYNVETTFFTIIVMFIIVLLFALLILRLIFLLFELPYMIRKRFQLNKMQKTHNSLLKAFANLSQQNNKKAIDIINKIEIDLNQTQKEFAHLILCNAEEEFDNQITHLRSLLSSPEYEYYASKKLAKLFIENKLYKQAEEYCMKCYNSNEKDGTILMLLVQCYGNLKKWDRFDFVIRRLSEVYSSHYYLIAEDISDFYFNAAKEKLANGDENEANICVRKSLEANPYNIDAMDLYITINISIEKTDIILAMLKSSYQQVPNFEVAQMIIRLLPNTPPEKIANELAELANPEEYPVLYLAITAYLGLEDKNRFYEPRLLN